MARELWLMRHGKAERFNGIEDYDRALKKRGKQDAGKIALWMKNSGLKPDLIISSPAIRALATAYIVCDILGVELQTVVQEKKLYQEGMVRVKSILAEHPEQFQTVLLVGHNPELEELLSYLINPLYLPNNKKLFPTAALARLTLPDDWTVLGRWDASLLSITYPKLLSNIN